MWHIIDPRPPPAGPPPRWMKTKKRYLGTIQSIRDSRRWGAGGGERGQLSAVLPNDKLWERDSKKMLCNIVTLFELNITTNSLEKAKKMSHHSAFREFWKCLFRTNFEAFSIRLIRVSTCTRVYTLVAFRKSYLINMSQATVNFINILRTHFLYEKLVPKIQSQKVSRKKLCKNFRTKKVGVKRWWNWHLVVAWIPETGGICWSWKTFLS